MEGCFKKERLPRRGETVSAVLSSLGDMAVLTGITRNAARSANSVYHDGLQLFLQTRPSLNPDAAARRGSFPRSCIL